MSTNFKQQQLLVTTTTKIWWFYQTNKTQWCMQSNRINNVISIMLAELKWTIYFNNFQVQIRYINTKILKDSKILFAYCAIFCFIFIRVNCNCYSITGLMNERFMRNISFATQFNFFVHYFFCIASPSIFLFIFNFFYGIWHQKISYYYATHLFCYAFRYKLHSWELTLTFFFA